MGEAVLLEHCPHPSEQQSQSAERRSVQKKCEKSGLETFSQWLLGFKVTHIVIESTGVYWIPAFNILEANDFSVILANARNVKNVPGRKTDCKDCEWLCSLLRNGLIEKSFIPPEKIRNLRAYARYIEIALF
jgi:transposase